MKISARKRLDDVREMLDCIKEAVEEIRDDEICWLDNMSEKDCSPEQHEKVEQAIESMEHTLDSLDELVCYLEYSQE